MRSTIWRDGRARLNAPDLKSGVGLNPPGVRIPLSPPTKSPCAKRRDFFLAPGQACLKPVELKKSPSRPQAWAFRLMTFKRRLRDHEVIPLSPSLSAVVRQRRTKADAIRAICESNANIERSSSIPVGTFSFSK